MTCTILFSEASSACLNVAFGKVKSIIASALANSDSMSSVIYIPIFFDLIILLTSLPKNLFPGPSVAPMSLKDLFDIIFLMIVCPILPEAPATIILIGFMISRINELN